MRQVIGYLAVMMGGAGVFALAILGALGGFDGEPAAPVVLRAAGCAVLLFLGLFLTVED